MHRFHRGIQTLERYTRSKINTANTRPPALARQEHPSEHERTDQNARRLPDHFPILHSLSKTSRLNWPETPIPWTKDTQFTWLWIWLPFKLSVDVTNNSPSWDFTRKDTHPDDATIYRWIKKLICYGCILILQTTGLTLKQTISVIHATIVFEMLNLVLTILLQKLAPQICLGSLWFAIPCYSVQTRHCIRVKGSR